MALNPVKPRRIVRVLDGLWNVGSAPHTLMALTALLAGTLALAAILPQQPVGLEGASGEQWLAGAAGSFREAGSFLRAVGAFHLTSGPWMRVLLAALALNLTLRVAAQVRFLHRFRQPIAPVAAPPRLIVHRTSYPAALQNALEHAERVLRLRFRVVTVAQDAGRAQIYAVGRPLGAIGPLLTYIGSLLVLLGLLANDTLGWRAVDIALAPGDTALLARSGNLRVTLDNIAGEENPAATLALAREDAVKNVRSAAGQPAVWGSAWLAQQGTGPVLAVTAQDGSGRPLVLQTLAPGGEASQTLHLVFRQTQGEQAFALPTHNLTFRAVSYPALPEQGIAGPVFLVEGYRGADPTPVFEALVEEQATLNADSLTIVLRRDRYVSLDAAGLPGLPFLLLGAALTLAGVMLSAFRGPVRAWIGMAEDGETVAVAVRAAVAAEPELETLRLLAALQPAPAEAEMPEPSDAG